MSDSNENYLTPERITADISAVVAAQALLSCASYCRILKCESGRMPWNVRLLKRRSRALARLHYLQHIVQYYATKGIE